MHMIFHPTDSESLHTVLSGDPSDVFAEPGLYLRQNGFTPVLRRENAMK
jgi:hypothetical protein